jgi:hypothetical protein
LGYEKRSGGPREPPQAVFTRLPRKPYSASGGTAGRKILAAVFGTDAHAGAPNCLRSWSLSQEEFVPGARSPSRVWLGWYPRKTIVGMKTSPLSPP